MYLKIMLMIQAPVRKLLSLNFLCLLSQADNEKYEHLGDTVLGLVVTGLLLDMAYESVLRRQAILSFVLSVPS
jgi:hypothetical protein